jgi:hypothetical protein
MSSVSVSQKDAGFQPVNIAMTISSEKELEYFKKVIAAGIERLWEDENPKSSLDLATTLLDQLRAIR